MNMSTIPADTTPEAAWVQIEVFRRMPAHQRLELAVHMSDALVATVAAGVRSRHPEYTEAQVQLAVIRLRLGDASFQMAYPGTEIAV
jgi:hypothetical protein